MSMTIEPAGYIPAEIAQRMDLRNNELARMLQVSDRTAELATIIALLQKMYYEGTAKGISSYTEYLYALSPVALRVLAALICTDSDGIEQANGMNPVQFETCIRLAGNQPAYLIYVPVSSAFEVTTHQAYTQTESTSKVPLISFIKQVTPIQTRK